ncbi:hypothetical protein I6N90_12095 [Paenibacillus sp. GSMTC-2017]|uniref:hypothetical protein n=1 Tax=Paenibacillus sp. GSMTC-2017 TaxID=2794350 RepID=UPI0018D90107|nr:hypothetical protein [Paenibacillus sp. GSMTC-2017]MBH5318546.1 hypothetical protein [Paenibacillus sp. GSMTC-2017]
MDNDRNQQEGTNYSSNSAGFNSFAPLPGNEAPIVKKHSGLGIASFILALLSIVCYIASVALIGSSSSEIINGGLNYQTEQEVLDSELFPMLAGAGLAIIAAIGLGFIGLILGIIGACMKNRKKLFSVLGIVLNVVFPVIILVLLLLGAAATV